MCAEARRRDEDRELVELCRTGGDPEAFRELVECYQERVLRLVAGILGPGRRAQAEEVTQEVFLRVHLSLECFRGESAFSSWLYRIAYNTALDATRSLRFRSTHLPEEALERDGAPSGPREAALETLEGRELRDAVASLPSLYRTIVHLHYWLGCSVAEIAEYLGSPEGTVKSYLHRARKRLRSALAERSAP